MFLAKILMRHPLGLFLTQNHKKPPQTKITTMKHFLIIILAIKLSCAISFAASANTELYACKYNTDTLSIWATSSCTSNVSYTWYKNEVLIPSATSNTLAFSNLQFNDGGYYRCATFCEENGTIIKHNTYWIVEVDDFLRGRPRNQYIVWYGDEDVNERAAYRDSLRAQGLWLWDSCMDDVEVWAELYAPCAQRPRPVVSDVRIDLDEDSIKIGGSPMHTNPSLPGYCKSNYQLRWERLSDTASYPYAPIVAILDTGFDTNDTLVSSFVWENPLADSTANCDTGTFSGYNAVEFCQDIYGSSLLDHGTAITNIIGNYIPSGVSPELMNIKVLNDDAGDLYNLVCGGLFSIRNGAKILNMSLSYYGHESPVMERFMQITKDSNVLVVTSAGNQKDSPYPSWPAHFSKNPYFDNIISVGAVDGDGNPTSFTNEGDIYAPGQNLLFDYHYGYSSIESGSSFASAFVTAAATTILAEEGDLLPNEVIQRLLTLDKWSSQGKGANANIRILNVDLLAFDDPNSPAGLSNDVTTAEDLNSAHYIDAYNEINASNRITPNGEVEYRAVNRIRFTEGFRAEEGSRMKASLDTCSEQ